MTEQLITCEVTERVRGLERARPDMARRFRLLLHGEDGMSTAEYAIGTIAAAAFASLLYTVVTGDSVSGALTSLLERALTATF